MRKYLSPLVAVLLICLAVALFCGCPSNKPAEPTAEETAPDPAAKTTVTPEPAPAGEFAWTETPALDQIPAGQVKGMINGKPFTAEAVRLEKRDDQMVLQIIDQKPETPSGMVTGETGVSLYLKLEEGKPTEYVTTIPAEEEDPADAIYYYPQGGDKGPMTMNSDWGAALKIDEWTMAPDASDEDVLGKVKGKVAVTFADDQKSWVAGEFDGVYYK